MPVTAHVDPTIGGRGHIILLIESSRASTRSEDRSACRTKDLFNGKNTPNSERNLLSTPARLSGPLDVYFALNHVSAAAFRPYRRRNFVL